MEYTTERALEEIIRRRKQVKRRRERKRCAVFAGMSCFLFAVLTLMINMIPVKSDAYSLGTAYGSFLLSPQEGGYVFTAVIAFAAGVSIAVYALRRGNRNEQENGRKENATQEDDGKKNDKTESDRKEGET